MTPNAWHALREREAFVVANLARRLAAAPDALPWAVRYWTAVRAAADAAGRRAYSGHPRVIVFAVPEPDAAGADVVLAELEALRGAGGFGERVADLLADLAADLTAMRAAA